MSDQPKGRKYSINKHKVRGTLLDAAIKRDDDGHWLREYALARWASSSVFPQVIERWVREIGEKAEWK